MSITSVVLLLLLAGSLASPLAAAEGEDQLIVGLERALAGLEERLAAVEVTLDIVEGSAEKDPELVAAGLRSVADSVRTVHRSVALLACGESVSEELVSGERMEALGRRLTLVDHRLATLGGAQTTIDPGKGCHPIFGCPPPPPDPFCVWLCELLNRLRCRLDPDCLLVPCSLVC